MVHCQICGNEIQQGKKRCPFCGSKQEGGRETVDSGPVRLHRTVNLEQGMPFVEPAIKRLIDEVSQAKAEKTAVLTIIHGYGSTGKGGVIRVECRKTLDHLVATGEITEFIVGEDFNRKTGAVKTLLRRYPGLGQNKNLNRGNKGVTIVVI